MSLTDWVLALHLLSAFALVGAMVLFWAVFLALHSGAELSAALGGVSRVGTITVAAGSIGTLVFGIWLALAIDGYALWDGWVIAAFVLWLIGTGTGERAGREMQREGGLQRATVLHATSSLAVLLLLVDMIWKPGA
jgi:hypothetical protein